MILVANSIITARDIPLIKFSFVLVFSSTLNLFLFNIKINNYCCPQITLINTDYLGFKPDCLSISLL